MLRGLLLDRECHSYLVGSAVDHSALGRFVFYLQCIPA